MYFSFEAGKKRGNYLSTYPFPKANFCGADAISAFVIDSDGRLYKCWNDIGVHNRAIGQLKNPAISNPVSSFETFKEYLLYDPTEDIECKDCKMLPICMGGCPSSRIQKADRCGYLKNYMDEYIRSFVKYKLDLEKLNEA